MRESQDLMSLRPAWSFVFLLPRGHTVQGTKGYQVLPPTRESCRAMHCMGSAPFSLCLRMAADALGEHQSQTDLGFYLTRCLWLGTLGHLPKLPEP